LTPSLSGSCETRASAQPPSSSASQEAQLSQDATPHVVAVIRRVEITNGIPETTILSRKSLWRASRRCAGGRGWSYNYTTSLVATVFTPVQAVIASLFAPVLTVFATIFATFHPRRLSRSLSRC
jgi:hypothetical protein